MTASITEHLLQAANGKEEKNPLALLQARSSTANGHGKCASLNDETREARFPLPSPPPLGEGDSVSLRELHVNHSSSIQLSTTEEDHHIARMAALALGLSVLEAAIPSPLPGVKPGLANIVTLIVLARYGWRAAAWVSLLRVLAGSLLMGNFLAPGFFLALSGALCSLTVLAASRHLPQRWFGPVTHSIFAAFAHIAGQLLMVYFWLIPHAGLLYLVPIFAIAALVFGTVNGLIASHFLNESPAGTVKT